MTRSLRMAMVAVASIAAVSPLFGQDRSSWRTADDIREGSRGSIVGTVDDVDDGSGQIQLVPDDATSAQVTVVTDSLSTIYNGFGGVINGRTEIFIGSKGFSNVRTGDRLEVRGTGRGTGTVFAEAVSLIGRSIPADQVGVGETRSPGNISTGSSGTRSTVTERPGRIDGTVRTVNGDDNRFVIETDRREMLTIRGSGTTPVHYRGGTYRIRDLEQGDRIRVDADTSAGTSGDVQARSIDVVQSAQERRGSASSSSGQVTTISGRITGVDRPTDTIRIDNGRGEVAVDVHTAADAGGHRVRAADLRVGDEVDITGAYGVSSDVFIASTIRSADQIPAQPAGPTRPPATGSPGFITIHGTITQSLRNAPQLTIRDAQSNASYRIYVLEDFIVRTKSGSYTTADRLSENDSVVLKAYRDADGNLIAQTIRMR
jgi:hypothetical protein